MATTESSPTKKSPQMLSFSFLQGKKEKKIERKKERKKDGLIIKISSKTFVKKCEGKKLDSLVQYIKKCRTVGRLVLINLCLSVQTNAVCRFSSLIVSVTVGGALFYVAVLLSSSSP